MLNPKVYADFNNADSQGRLRLNCIGTVEDLSRLGIILREGLMLCLYEPDVDREGKTDELLVDGAVTFSVDEHCWVAAIDWHAIHHASEYVADTGNGQPNRLKVV